MAVAVAVAEVVLVVLVVLAVLVAPVVPVVLVLLVALVELAVAAAVPVPVVAEDIQPDADVVVCRTGARVDVFGARRRRKGTGSVASGTSKAQDL